MKTFFGLLIVVLCLSVLPTSSWAVSTDDFHALIVSADDSYVQSEAKLNYATLDAERMVRAIRSVGQVANTNINILNNPKVSKVSEIVKKLQKKGIKKFLFYYSGHSDEEGLHFKDGQISRTRFHSMLKGIPAKTKIVVLDSCFSGALKQKGIKTSKPIELVQYDIDEPTGSVILTSSSQTEFSYESEKLRGSIFTYHLVSGLYGQADGNSDGVVTINELYQYVYAQTKYQSLVSGGVAQHPEFQSRLSGRGALVVSFPAKTNGVYNLDKDLSGELTLAAVNGMNFFKFYKNRGEEKSISVPAGGYLLTLEDSQEIGVSQARLAANKTIKLKRSDFQWKKSDDHSSVQKKGVDQETKNEFLFGLLLGRHSGFEDSLRAGPILELSVLTPTLNMLWGKWRLSAHLGGQSNESNQPVNFGQKTELNRITIGFEGNYSGFSQWNQQWIIGLRGGRLASKETTDHQSFANFTLGVRFQPVNWPVKWGLELSSENFETDAGVKKEASMFSLVVYY